MEDRKKKIVDDLRLDLEFARAMGKDGTISEGAREFYRARAKSLENELKTVLEGRGVVLSRPLEERE